MYEDHFGLRARPFRPCPGAPGLVRLPSRDAASRRLRYALEHLGGPALLVGPSGVGKSLLARAVGAELGGPVVHLAYPALPPLELVALLADDLDPPAPDIEPGPRGDRPGWADALRRLRGALGAAAARGERPLLIVEDAHLIGRGEAWDALRLLLNFAHDGEPDLRLLLVAAPEVLAEIPGPLADRLAARALLGPLTLGESARYVLGRLAHAEAPAPLFDPPSLAALHQAAEGVPRRLDHLADLSLLVAAAEGRPGATPADVRAAAAESPFDLLAA